MVESNRCFVAMSEDLLSVLFDLPVDMTFEWCETVEVLASDDSKRKVHLFHFTSDVPEHQNQLDFQYTVNQVTRAITLHSIRYSSVNREDEPHAAQGKDARGANR